MTYLPIESYGLIGNMRSAALVGINGSIDWMCLPRFDSGSVFGAILDDAKGGRFHIHPQRDECRRRQFYWPDTNILVTRFQFEDAVAEVIDFMPVGVPAEAGRPPDLVRICRGVYGEVPLRILCQPAFDYARAEHEVVANAHGVVFAAPGCGVTLASTGRLKETADGRGVEAVWRLKAGQSESLVLSFHEGRPRAPEPLRPERVERLFEESKLYWRQWIGMCTYSGRWQETVRRSALTLKMLTYEPTGALIAAPTCSLPAPIGGERNWDYRYTWIRDAAFTVYALMRIGFTREVVRFTEWIHQRCRELEPEGMLLPVYGIDGRHELPESTLDHLEGYRGSRPVRVGNAAYEQLQIDIAGELMDSIYLHNKYAEPLTLEVWEHLLRILEWVCSNWTRKDFGVWEVRGPTQHFVYSKVMCWVALDRGLRLVDRRSLPGDVEKWRRVRDEIYREILDKGYSDQRRCFVQRYGSEALDAANLIMPLVFFMAPNEPRMMRTIDESMKPLREGGLLADTQVHRYRVEETDDGLEGSEGGFNICTFWLIEAQTRAGKFEPQRLESARVLFEKMLGSGNHLGLYGEQTGMKGEVIGNYPQAFTHLSLISAAYNLDRALSGSKSSPDSVLEAI